MSAAEREDTLFRLQIESVVNARVAAIGTTLVLLLTGGVALIGFFALSVAAVTSKGKDYNLADDLIVILQAPAWSLTNGHIFTWGDIADAGIVLSSVALLMLGFSLLAMTLHARAGRDTQASFATKLAMFGAFLFVAGLVYILSVFLSAGLGRGATGFLGMFVLLLYIGSFGGFLVLRPILKTAWADRPATFLVIGLTVPVLAFLLGYIDAIPAASILVAVLVLTFGGIAYAISSKSAVWLRPWFGTSWDESWPRSPARDIEASPRT